MITSYITGVYMLSFNSICYKYKCCQCSNPIPYFQVSLLLPPGCLSPSLWLRDHNPSILHLSPNIQFFTRKQSSDKPSTQSWQKLGKLFFQRFHTTLSGRKTWTFKAFHFILQLKQQLHMSTDFSVGTCTSNSLMLQTPSDVLNSLIILFFFFYIRTSTRYTWKNSIAFRYI